MTITKEGSLASFYTVNKAPIKHLRVYFSPKQAGSGDPSPENVREINGWNELKISQSSNTNLFYQDTLLQAQGWTKSPESISSFNGVPVYYGTIANLCGSGKPFQTELPVNFQYEPNTQYRVTYWWRRYTPSTSNGMKVYFDYTDGTSTNTPNNSNNTENFVRVTTTSTSGKTVAKIHLNYNSSSSIYIAGFAIEKIDGKQSGVNDVLQSAIVYPISLSSVGTIYGGYVDLITGELVQEQIGQTFTGADSTSTTEYTNTKSLRFRFYTPLKGNGNTKAGVTMSDKLIYSYNNNDDFFHYYITDNNTNGNLYAFVPLDFGDNDSITFIASLYTPVTYQLTPTQLQTFIGQNNIWSNADRVEVEYDLAESNDELYRRRNIILQSVPHLETASGNIANFNTDLMAPLKECKIYFNPIQEGTGDPSLSNVRNISGYTGMSIYRSGKNLLDPSLYARNTTYELNGTTYVYDGNGTITLSGKSNGQSSQTTFAWTQPFDCNYYYCGNPSFDTDIGDIYMWDITTNARPTKWDGTTSVGSSYLNKNLQEVRLLAGHRINIHIRVYSTNTVAFTNETARPMLLPATCTDTTFEPYNGQTISLNWADNYGTIYGGYVDLINGTLTKTWHSITADGINIKANSAYIKEDRFGAGIVYLSPYGNHTTDNLSKTTIKCNKLLPVGQQETIASDQDKVLWCARNGKSFVIFLLFKVADYETMPTNAEIINMTNTWLQDNPTQIVYKLYSPVTYQLTPQQLLTLHGTNNIWSDANGPVSITYWTH